MQKVNEIKDKIGPLSKEIFLKTQEKLDNLTKPRGSLGKLEDLAKKVVAITENLAPVFGRKVIFVFAADHGVAEEGVSAYPQQVTCQMVYNFLRGGAGINVLAKHTGAEVVITDVGVAEDIKPHPNLIVKKIGYGTRNMVKKETMGKKQAIQSLEVGIEVFEKEHRKNPIGIVGLGEMGIANTTCSSAVLAAVTKKDPEKVTGRGTGVDDSIWQKKVQVVKKALEHRLPLANDPLDVLAKVGGYEIGAIAGCILAAVRYKVPVVIDGFISTVGAIIAVGIVPEIKDYLFASHLSPER